MKSNNQIESKLKEARNKGLIVPRTENNQYLKVSYKGAGKLVSEKWNIKIYTTGSIVCNDFPTLDDIVSGKIAPPDQNKTLIQIDDAGVGFPMCGVMVGVTDGDTVYTDVVDVSYFKPGAFEKKAYLKEYTRKGYDIVVRIFKATPQTHRIEICTGYINTRLKSYLREKGFDVRVVDIKGRLQEELEDLYKDHVKKQAGVDLAYDPKNLGSKKDLANNYYRVLRWGLANAPHLLKSGWESIKNMERKPI